MFVYVYECMEGFYNFDLKFIISGFKWILVFYFLYWDKFFKCVVKVRILVEYYGKFFVELLFVFGIELF